MDTLCQHHASSPCADSSYSKCPHCSLDLCLDHIIEHQQVVRLEFNKTIDQINEQRSLADDHSALDALKSDALERLNDWKLAKIDHVVSIYKQQRARIEDAHAQSIAAKNILQSQAFDELNAQSNVIDKRRNIHPNDLIPMKNKLEELLRTTQDILKNAQKRVDDIVANTELPQIVELQQKVARLADLDSKVKNLEKQLTDKNWQILQMDMEVSKLKTTDKLRETQLKDNSDEIKYLKSVIEEQKRRLFPFSRPATSYH